MPKILHQDNEQILYLSLLFCISLGGPFLRITETLCIFFFELNSLFPQNDHLFNVSVEVSALCRKKPLISAWTSVSAESIRLNAARLRDPRRWDHCRLPARQTNGRLLPLHLCTKKLCYQPTYLPTNLPIPTTYLPT